MAIEQDNQEQNNNQQNPSAPGQELQLGTGTSGTPIAPSGASGSPSNRQQPQGSGRFANLQKYVQANKGFDVGGQISGQAQGRLSGIRQGIEASRNQAQNQAGQLQNQLGTGGQQLAQQAFQDPNAVLQNQQQAQEFQKLRTGGYGQDISGLGQNINQYQQGIQNLQNQAQQAGTEAGRFNLLQQRFGQPGYSRGQQRLDQLLLQATPGAAASLRSGLQGYANQAQEAQTGYQTDVAAKQTALNQLAQQRQNEINNMLQYGSNNEVGGEEALGQMGYADIEKNLQNKLSQAQTTLPQQYQTAKESLLANTNNASGLVPLQTGANIYNLNLADYLAPEDILKGRLSTATAQQMASPEDYQRYQALQQLAGNANNSFFGNIDQSQLGKFNPITYDTGKFQSDLANRQQQAQEYSKNINDSLASLIPTINSRGLRKSITDTNYNNLTNAIQDYQNNPDASKLASLVNLAKSATKGFNFGYDSGMQNLGNQLNQLYNIAPKYAELNPQRLYGAGSVGPSPIPTDNTGNI